MFTLENTFYEIMNTDPVKRAVGNLFPSCWYQRVAGEHVHDTMLQIAKEDTMEWGDPFLSEEFIECANLLMEAYSKQRFCFVPLWREQEKGWVPDADLNCEEGVFLFTGNPEIDNRAFAHTAGSRSIPPYRSKAVPEEKRKRTSGYPAVILCPGGGYEMLSSYSEGIQLAQRMERDGGYKAFILNYRIRPNAYPLPQMDLAMAVMHVRAHAKSYGVDPDRVFLLGASAGGHLCASEAFLHEDLKQEIMKTLPDDKREKYRDISARPDGIGLLYPVISFCSQQHEGSYLGLTNGREGLREKLSVEFHITSEYPPTYAFANEDDGCVPVSNTIRLDEALEKAGVPHLCQIYPQGDHGVGLGYRCSCKEWSENMLAFWERLLENL